MYLEKMYFKTAKPAQTGPIGRRFDEPRGGTFLVRGFVYAWQRVRRWRVETDAIRHLESLEDSRLEDLGIERRKIALAVRGMLQQQEKPRASKSADDRPRGYRLAA